MKSTVPDMYYYYSHHTHAWVSILLVSLCVCLFVAKKLCLNSSFFKMERSNCFEFSGNQGSNGYFHAVLVCLVIVQSVFKLFTENTLFAFLRSE